MTTCRECQNFCNLEEDKDRGDCVQQKRDPRQAYYQAKPVNSDDDASSCASFQKRPK